MLIAYGVVFCIGLVMLIVAVSTPVKHSETGPAAGMPAPIAAANQSHSPAPKKSTTPPAADNLIDDDGNTLWASPTNGPPLDLAYLPPGSQFIAALRHEPIESHPRVKNSCVARAPR